MDAVSQLGRKLVYPDAEEQAGKSSLGWFSIGSYLSNPNVSNYLIDASRIDHQTFANFFAAFDSLYKYLSAGRSRSQILQSIQAALEAIATVIQIPPSDFGDTDEEFLRPNAEVMRHIAEVFAISEECDSKLCSLHNELVLWHKALIELRSFMEGSTPNHACTKTELKRLLTQIEHKLLQTHRDSSQTGFLHLLRDIRSRQRGKLTDGLEAVINSVVTLAERALIGKCNAGVGTSFGVPQRFTLRDDPTIPGLEKLDDGQIKRNAHKKPPSVFQVVMILLNGFKRGENLNHTEWRVDLLLPILQFVRNQVSQASSPKTQAALDNLDKSLQLLETLKTSELSQEEQEQTLLTVKANLDNCLIGIMRYLPYVPLSKFLDLPATEPDEGETKEPIQELQETIQLLQGLQTATSPAIIDDETRYRIAFREFNRTAAWMSAYKAIELLIGEIPSSLVQKPMSFSQIMSKIYNKDGSLRISNPIEQHNVFLDALLENINRSSHLFFFTRFLLRLFVPIVVHISNFTIARIVSGTKNYVDNLIQNAHSPTTGKSNIVPLSLFAEVAKAYNSAHERAADPKNLGYTTEAEIIEDAFYNDPNRRFLRGHSDRASVYSSLGEAIIDEFLASLNFTNTLSRINADLLEWSLNSDWFIIQSIFWIATAPIRLLFALINTLIFYPVEVIANTVLYYVAKVIVSRTNIAEQITNLSLNSLTKKTDFTSVLDEVVLDLLKMLWDLLQAPPNPNNRSFSDLQTTPTTTSALSKALATLIDAVAIGDAANTSYDIRNFQGPGCSFDATDALRKKITKVALDSVASLLDKSWQLLLERRTKLAQLLLDTVTRSMRSNGRELTAVALEAETQQHTRTKDLTENYLKLLLWECVKSGTAHLRDGPNPEHEINKHIERIQKNLGFTTTSQSGAVKEFTPASEEHKALGHTFASKINHWHELLINITANRLPNPLEALDTILMELMNVATSMQHELSLMESRGSVEKSACQAHEKNVLLVSGAIREFATHFFVISDYVRKIHCSNKGQLGQAAYAVGSIKDLSLELIVTLKDLPTTKEAQTTWVRQIVESKGNIQKSIDYLTKNFGDITGPLPGLTNATAAALESLDRAKKEETFQFNLGVWVSSLTTHDHLLEAIKESIRYRSTTNLKTIITKLEENLADFLMTTDQDSSSTNSSHYQDLKKQIDDFLRVIDMGGDQENALTLADEFYTSFSGQLENFKQSKLRSLNKTLTTASSNLENIVKLAQEQHLSLTHATKFVSNQPIDEEQIPIQAAKESLIKIEKGAIGLRDIHKLTLDALGQLPFLSMAQRGVFAYTRKYIEKSLRQIFTDREFLEGFAMRAFIEFLESHGKSQKHKASR